MSEATLYERLGGAHPLPPHRSRRSRPPRMTGLSAVAGSIGTVLGVVSAPVWATAAATAAVAIAAVGAAGLGIYKNWDAIAAIFEGVAGAVGDRLKPVFGALAPALEPIAPAAHAIGDPRDAGTLSGLGRAC